MPYKNINDRRAAAKRHYWKYAINEKTRKRKYYLSNKESKLASGKEYYRNNSIKVKAAHKRYRLNNIEKTSVRHKIYRLNNPEKVKEGIKRWEKNNPKKVRAKQLRWHNNKTKIDFLYKCKYIIRCLIRGAISRAKYTKSSRTYQILGCPFDEFKAYIESKFTKGMTWLNHGEWHLDHIIPMAAAKTEEEVIILNHYTNFQPLWATSKIAEKYGEVGYIGNLEKGDRLITT